ncbi:MAG: heme biosynthesis HemY N-terminal domain-containing protein [Burkholderiaceae bacterium]|nr:heme biosynthesis HemY N-terminal domain-containing protein [Burkholderiaceae bacterium]
MRGVIWLVLLFVAAVVAATTLGRNDGLVSLYWSGWRLDVSLNLFVIALVLSCLALLFAMRALQSLASLPARAHEWRVRRRERAAQASLREALAEYFGARYGRARKAAARAVAIHEATPELVGDLQTRRLAHLLWGASLHRLQDRPQRDQQLTQLRRLGRRLRSGDDGVPLMAAEWALDDRDAPRALALLAELPPGVARRTQALRLKLQAQRLAGQPDEALRTARLLAKHQAFSHSAAQSLLRSLAGETLGAARDPGQLDRAWQELDPADRADPLTAARAATCAARLGALEHGRRWLLPAWQRLAELGRDERDAVALALIDNLPGLPAEWLQRVEAAERALPGDPAVQAAAGSAYAERQLWGKARTPLERAAASATLDGSARRAAWRRLATLARAEGDEARAARCHEAAAKIDQPATPR